MAEEKLCGDVWETSLPHITCQRKLNEQGKHTGKHIAYDEQGKPIVSWWGGPRT